MFSFLEGLAQRDKVRGPQMGCAAMGEYDEGGGVAVERESVLVCRQSCGLHIAPGSASCGFGHDLDLLWSMLH